MLSDEEDLDSKFILDIEFVNLLKLISFDDKV